MLSQKSRVVFQKEFQELYQKGKRCKSLHFLVYWKEISSPGHRYAIVVPNKVIQKATMRNKVRRRLRSIIHQNRGIVQGKAIIINVKKNIAKSSYLDIAKEINEVFISLC